MRELVLVFVGGGLGSVLRYFFSKWINTNAGWFPLPTFMANVLACGLFGIVCALTYQKLEFNESFKKLMLTGFCGGLSTFSTFNYELFDLIKSGNTWYAAIYLTSSVIICFLTFVLTLTLLK